MQKTQEGAERARVIINVEAEQGRQCKRKRCRETQIKCERVEGKRVKPEFEICSSPSGSCHNDHASQDAFFLCYKINKR